MSIFSTFSAPGVSFLMLPHLFFLSLLKEQSPRKVRTLCFSTWTTGRKAQKYGMTDCGVEVKMDRDPEG
jgi:hypothetical protein